MLIHRLSPPSNLCLNTFVLSTRPGWTVRRADFAVVLAGARVQDHRNGLNGRDKEAVHRKVEELNWKKVLLHGVGGWAGRYSTPGKKFDGGFFLLRLVTSVLFLHSYVPSLSPTSISILLRAYFSTSLALYIARGRPALRIRNFYASAANPPARARPRAHTTQRRALRGADDERMVPDPAAHTRAQRRLPREAPAFPSALRQPLRRDAGGSVRERARPGRRGRTGWELVLEGGGAEPG
ncbi:hypothetical protein EVJ58_g1560 [Rhodofomes roseus]|uniref:Uncharacterized protein n=1 Tax=Rhodofomes roseus TaxID=34475 RepID=A0A4Y9Z0L5_9APHY|nr:hypothetical protein EVJ58_g1560 [Rhodofomes roseus]